MEAEYLLESFGPTVAPASSHISGCISSLELTGVGSLGVFTYQSISVLLHLGKFTTFGCLGIEHFQPPLDISCELCASSSRFSSPGSIQVPGRMSERSFRLHILVYGGGFLASHRSQHVGRQSSSVSHHKDCHGCLNQLGAQGFAITAFNPLAAQR